MKKEKVVSFTATPKALPGNEATKNSDKYDWYIDSGASRHLTCNREWMTEVVTLPAPVKIYLADNSVIVAKEEGTVLYRSGIEESTVIMRMENVLFIPEMAQSLFSVCQAASKGVTTCFDKDGCSLMKNGELVGRGTRENGIFKLQFSEYQDHVTANVVTTNKGLLWHKRLGHLSEIAMKKMIQDQLVTGLNLHNCSVEFCGNCAQGKLSKTKFPTGSHRTSKPLELVHMDLCGPMETLTPTKNRYFMVLVDDATRFTHVSLLKRKEEAFAYLKTFKALVENFHDLKIKAIQSDNGGEFTSKEFINFCNENGIKRRTSNPYTPEQNGVAERMNQTLVECARTMLHAQGMPKTLWGAAINTACYLRNRSYTSTLNQKTPYEAWTKEKPDVSHFKVLGSEAWVHVEKSNRQKWDPKAIRCRFIGYGITTKGYLFVPWDSPSGPVITSRNAIFNEEGTIIEEEITEPNEESDSEPEDLSEDSASESEEPLTEETDEPTTFHSQPSSDEDLSEDDDVSQEPATTSTRKSSREKTQTKFYNPSKMLSLVASINEEPSTYQEAITSKDSDLWKAAMTEELKSLYENGTWEEATLPRGRKTIGCKWVYKIKRDNEGVVIRYKARLVAKGFSQKEGIDYGEIFAPVAKYKTIRMLLGIASKNNLILGQLDVKTAFLNDILKVEIYMELPKGYPTKPVGVVCKLIKSLYGLKQSPMEWNSALDQYLLSIGFKPTAADPCLYVRNIKEELVLLAVYVDDIVVAASTKALEIAVKKELMSKFEMTDLGELNWYLGMKVTRNPKSGTIYLDQSQYIQKVLEKFSMTEAKPANTPMSSDPDATEKTEPADAPYREAVGCFMYAMIGTRPDIAYAVSVASRYLENPEVKHWVLVKRILRYLKGTLNMCLCYSRESEGLLGYSDADWAGDHTDRKSTTGFCFTMSGAAVVWLSKKQPCVALSTTEAEYIALCAATQEAIW